ncbi:hypothetical protein [Paracoccus sanguinis]|uniref:hypothetical protein n=1 Tax=Paracoccus sanguinis TaxID=1545044 RepID=UPI000698A9ED|nr:hypothetical protein [Paracoccus sanguinis]
MTRAGKQTVRVAVIEVGPPPRRDLIAGDFTVSDDFDSMGADEVGALFEGAPPRNPAVNLLIDT